MKVTDLSEIKAAAAEELAEFGSEILEYLQLDEAANCFTTIYITNNTASGVGQDFLGNLSIVSSPTRVAVIFLGHHSYYKHDGPICDYDNLVDDMHEINMCINAALLRWQEQHA